MGRKNQGANPRSKKDNCGSPLRSYRKWGLVWDRLLPVSLDSNKRSVLTDSDRHVIALDVSRTAAHWDIHQYLSISKRIAKRKLLSALLLKLGTVHENFGYYQGLHEVGLVILEVCDCNLSEALPLLSRFVSGYFGAFVQSDFNTSLLPMLAAVEYLVRLHNPELAIAIEQSGGYFHYAIPWILTWFSHSLWKFTDICQTFNFFIVQGPCTPIYFCAAITLLDSRRIMSNFQDSCHVIKCTQNSVRFVSLLESRKLTCELMRITPPTILAGDIPGIQVTTGPESMNSVIHFREFVALALATLVAGIAWAVGRSVTSGATVLSALPWI